MRWVQGRLDDPPVQITISLLTPFAAYLLAERLEVSGVLSSGRGGRLYGVAFDRVHRSLPAPGTGLLGDGRLFPQRFHLHHDRAAVTRHPSHLEPRTVVAPDDRRLLISATVVIVRIAWVFPATYLPRWLSRKMRERDPVPPWQHSVLIAWAGMRGVVSLAAAFALPIVLADRHPFPGRSYILFLTFCVILTTLVFQGLTLPILIRKLGVEDDGVIDDEERRRAFAGERSRGRFHRKKGARRTFPRGSDDAGAGGIL